MRDELELAGRMHTAVMEYVCVCLCVRVCVCLTLAGGHSTYHSTPAD